MERWWDSNALSREPTSPGRARAKTGGAQLSDRGRNLVVDRELSKVVARLDLLAAQADEKYRRAALDFSQNWLLGSLVPFFSMVQR